MNIREQLDAVKAELLPLATAAELDADGIARYETLAAEFDTLEKQVADADAFEARRKSDIERLRRLAPASSGREGDGFDRDPLGDPTDVQRVSAFRNPWDIDEVSRTRNSEELVSRALSAVEQTPGSSDARREVLTRMVEGPDGDTRLARLVLATTSPAYKTAYGKIARSGGSTNDLNAEERDAVAFAQDVARAMSTTDAAGGYLIPTDIEAAVTLSTAGTNNPIYSRARRVQTTGDTYRVVTSPHAAWSWDGENAEVSDDATTFGNADIPLYIAQGFVPYSFASAHSISNITSIVADVLMGGWNDLVGAALTTGSGSSQPTGIVTALTGGSIVASAATDTFAIADVYATFEPLPARHRRNAVWMSSVEALNDIRQFGTADSHALLTRLADGEEGLRLLGKPWIENEDMDGSITALADNKYLLFGDFNHFVVAEGLGTVTRFIPDVVGSTGRPIGASGVFMMAHFGSDCVLDDAFRILNVT